MRTEKNHRRTSLCERVREFKKIAEKKAREDADEYRSSRTRQAWKRWVLRSPIKAQLLLVFAPIGLAMLYLFVLVKFRLAVSAAVALTPICTLLFLSVAGTIATILVDAFDTARSSLYFWERYAAWLRVIAHANGFSTAEVITALKAEGQDRRAEITLFTWAGAIWTTCITAQKELYNSQTSAGQFLRSTFHVTTLPPFEYTVVLCVFLGIVALARYLGPAHWNKQLLTFLAD